VPVLLEELQRVREKATTDEQRAFIDKVQALAEACGKEEWRFVKFYGDYG